MKGSEFAFNCVDLLYYKCHKINPNYDRSYIDTEKDKKSTMKPINKKNKKCFQYAVIVALNYEEVKKDWHRITKIKPFINKYNWEERNFSSEKDYWKKF